MGKKSQSNQINTHTQKRTSKAGAKSAVLAELAGRFARFRAKHPRGTRVPEELRVATLAALRKGATTGDLYRTCRIGRNQIAAWSGSKSNRRTRTSAVSNDVRIFSVVDPEPRDRHEAVEHELELRLGRWSVFVRLTDPTPEA